MTPDTEAFNAALAPRDRAIADRLATEIDRHLPEADNRIWHAHPVWFLDANPVVGYSKLKDAVRLMFWSGQSFASSGLTATGSFKAAEVRFTDKMQIDMDALAAWLAEARTVQWDYKNVVKRKGTLIRIR